MYLLDTIVVSELLRSKPHGGVRTWLNSANDADLHLSAVTLVAITAVMRKLVTLANTLLAEDRMWQPEPPKAV